MTDRVVVTGAAGGIGSAILERLAKDGYRCVALDRDLPADRGPHQWLQVDLSDPKATAAALEEALAGGAITRLVNNVGMVRPAAIEDVTFADLEAVVSLNLRCAVQCTQALLPGMKASGEGRIVSISSRAALGKELRTVYAATKAGIHGMTKTWALELGRYGITANAIGPGPIRTKLFEQVNPPGEPRTLAIVEAIPVKRMGEGADIAHAVAMFLDARAGFTTGQVLYVCGGMTVGLAD